MALLPAVIQPGMSAILHFDGITVSDVSVFCRILFRDNKQYYNMATAELDMAKRIFLLT